MTESRRGLGRGLSALLDEVEAPIGESHRNAGLMDVPIELIQRNPDQPRRRFNDADIDELAASIRLKGVLQPILVRAAKETHGEYQIVAGERRWRAAQRAGMRVVPALVRELSDVEVLGIAMIENIQRTDLSPIEEAEGYRTLVERYGRTQALVADTVGKSRVHVANALRLLQLPDAVQALVREGRLTAGHARPLVGKPDAEALARQVVDRELNVRQVEALASGRMTLGGVAAAQRTGKHKDADTLALETDLGEALGLPVEIRDRGGSGELSIRYGTLEQLDEVCRRLTRG
ncbi:MAG: ParB/RepB/Spo0J family partition protein [Caulobacterales bacterium]